MDNYSISVEGSNCIIRLVRIDPNLTRDPCHHITNMKVYNGQKVAKQTISKNLKQGSKILIFIRHHLMNTQMEEFILNMFHSLIKNHNRLKIRGISHQFIICLEQAVNTVLDYREVEDLTSRKL